MFAGLQMCEYGKTKRGIEMLRINGHYYRKNTMYKDSIVWRCFLYESIRCKARAKTVRTNPGFAKVMQKNPHIHGRDVIHLFKSDIIQTFNESLQLPYFHDIKSELEDNNQIIKFN